MGGLRPNASVRWDKAAPLIGLVRVAWSDDHFLPPHRHRYNSPFIKASSALCIDRLETRVNLRGPNITAFHTIILSGLGLPDIPIGGSDARRLKSRISLRFAVVDCGDQQTATVQPAVA
jgi:hypothetical protein